MRVCCHTTWTMSAFIIASHLPDVDVAGLQHATYTEQVESSGICQSLGRLYILLVLSAHLALLSLRPYLLSDISCLGRVIG